MGAAAVPLFYVVTAMSTAYGINAKRMAARVAQDQADRAVRVQEMEAAQATRRGQIESGNVLRKAGQLEAHQLASFGASGAAVGSGSPLEVMADTAMMGRLDASTVEYNAQMTRWARQQQAQQYREQGQMAAAEGNTAIWTGLLEGGTKMYRAGLGSESGGDEDINTAVYGNP